MTTEGTSPLSRLPVYVTVFVCGAAVMAFEILGSRVLAPYFGSSVFVWGSLIGVFMAGLSAGYFFGGWMGDRWRSARALMAILLIPGLLVALFPLYGFEAAEWIFLLDPGPRLGPLLACMALFFVPTAFMGAVSPYCIMLVAVDSDRIGREVGTLYALSTLGSIAGTLGTAFYLVVLSGTRSSLYMTGSVLVLLSILAWATVSPSQIRKKITR